MATTTTISTADRRERALRKMKLNPVLRNRYENMRAIIETNGHAEVSRACGVSPQTMSQVAGSTFVDVISDRRAREWEEYLGLPAMFLDADHGLQPNRVVKITDTGSSIAKKAHAFKAQRTGVSGRIAEINAGSPPTASEARAIELASASEVFDTTGEREQIALTLLAVSLRPAHVDVSKLQALVTHLARQKDRTGKLPAADELAGLLDLLK